LIRNYLLNFKSLKKKIAILGSTGSIGIQALEVVQQHPDKFQIEALTAKSNYSLLCKQAIAFDVNTVVIADDKYYKETSERLADTDIKVFSGSSSVSDIVEMEKIDIVINALVGFAGLLPSLRAIEYGKTIALANKESLVVAGEIIMQKIQASKARIIPVDSEHSAIFQCIMGESSKSVKKIILTASGGPFRETAFEDFPKINVSQALKHPNWNMGNKISIDSATMMNKGLEIIEAYWLFGIDVDKIEVIVHPQSIIHSFVEFSDNSIKAQLGLPDMRTPIQFALSYPNRLNSSFPAYNFLDYPTFSFEKADKKKFPAIDLAYEALNKGGNIPCCLNAANEIAVDAFLKEKISFVDIPKIVEYCINHISFAPNSSLDDLIETNTISREMALNYISKTIN